MIDKLEVVEIAETLFKITEDMQRVSDISLRAFSIAQIREEQTGPTSYRDTGAAANAPQRKKSENPDTGFPISRSRRPCLMSHFKIQETMSQTDWDLERLPTSCLTQQLQRFVFHSANKSKQRNDDSNGSFLDFSLLSSLH